MQPCLFANKVSHPALLSSGILNKRTGFDLISFFLPLSGNPSISSLTRKRSFSHTSNLTVSGTPSAYRSLLNIFCFFHPWIFLTKNLCQCNWIPTLSLENQPPLGDTANSYLNLARGFLCVEASIASATPSKKGLWLLYKLSVYETQLLSTPVRFKPNYRCEKGCSQPFAFRFILPQVIPRSGHESVKFRWKEDYSMWHVYCSYRRAPGGLPESTLRGQYAITE